MQVSEKSFHEVAEVLTSDRTRLSVGGWFHSDSNPSRPQPKSLGPTTRCHLPPFDISRDDFLAWINPVYLEEETQMEIKVTFKATSEICLSNFLAVEKYAAVCAALKESNLPWTEVGPANRAK